LAWPRLTPALQYCKMATFSARTSKRDSAFSGVSISLVDQADVSPEALDQLILKIENGVIALKGAEGNTVRSSRAEMNLVTSLDRVRDMMDITMKGKNRELLRKCWAGDDGTRIVTLHELLNQVELKMNPDQRRLDVIQRATNIEELLMDIGYADQMRAAYLVFEEEGIDGLHRQADAAEAEKQIAEAKSAQQAAQEVGHQDGMVHEVLPDLAKALVVGSAAMELEDEGKIAEAIEMYDNSYKALCAAVTVIQACMKFKASLGNVSKLEEDAIKLGEFRQQVEARKDYLETLPEDTKPEIPIDEHIKPPKLSVVSKRSWVGSLLLVCGTTVVGGGLGILAGPFLGLIFAGVGLLGGGVAVAAKVADEAKAEDKAKAER